MVEGDNTRPVNMDYCNFWHSIGAYSTAAILYSVNIAIYSTVVGISGNKPLPEFPHSFCCHIPDPVCLGSVGPDHVAPEKEQLQKLAEGTSGAIVKEHFCLHKKTDPRIGQVSQWTGLTMLMPP